MVLFDNVYLGQRIEVRWNSGVYKGTVQYKGPIATRKGEWVGVELDLPVGDTAGMLFARSYFQCRHNHGVFVRADKLRFIPSERCLYNKYHTVSNSSGIEEFLFHSTFPEVKNGPYDPVRVSPGDIQRVQSSLGGYRNTDWMWEKPKAYHLRHLVSNHIPAATMLRPATSVSDFRYLSQPVHVHYWLDNEFERKPSIPKTHMPHSALKEQVRKGWEGAHYVREMTVPTGRDKIKFAQWNDISP